MMTAMYSNWLLNGLCDGFQLNVADMTTPQHTWSVGMIANVSHRPTIARHCFFYHSYGTHVLRLLPARSSTQFIATNVGIFIYFYNNMGHFEW